MQLICSRDSCPLLKLVYTAIFILGSVKMTQGGGSGGWRAYGVSRLYTTAPSQLTFYC